MLHLLEDLFNDTLLRIEGEKIPAPCGNRPLWMTIHLNLMNIHLNSMIIHLNLMTIHQNQLLFDRNIALEPLVRLG